MAKGSLLPENAVGGSIIADGDYLIKEVVAQMFDYGGKADEVPAITVLYASDDGATVEQSYSAGKGASLVSPPDGKRFEVIGKNSNAWKWIASMLNSGFPKANVDDDVSVFEGCRVTVVNQAQPKQGFKDEKEGKTLPLVTKVLALPSAAKGRPTAAAARPATSTARAATSGAASAATASSNGELDARAIEVIQEIVATAPDNTITRLKLGTAVMLTLAKAKDPQMASIKKLATDAAWLVANAELGGWTSDGETVVIG